jgi:tripartite-type tricarboxylate transporter receptor subunit TctC
LFDFEGKSRREDILMSTKRVILSVVVAISLTSFAAVTASAQSYPNRLIKLVLPFPAGGPTDGAARLIAERLSASLGQTVVIENRAGGAGGTVGAKSVATADPDGYTLLFTPPGPLVTAPLIFKSVGYDPVKDFAPVATIFSSPQVLVVNPAVPAKSMRELVAYAKANPGKVSYASPGFGTQPHLLGEMLKLETGTDIVHVPFRGSAPAFTDLLAGQVQVFFDTVTFLLPHVEAGKVRPLAIADEARSLQLPNVPTTAESGFPKLQGTYWTAIVAPAGTPPDVINKLNAAINAITTSKEMEETLSKLSAKAKVGSPADFKAFMAAETRKWGEVITAANIKGE